MAAPGVAVALPAGVPVPSFAARSWLLADLGTGAVIAARGAHQRDYPASTLKTLTLLAAHSRVDQKSVVTPIPGDLAEGSRVGLVPGQKYTVRNLFEGAMLASGNDAATALARVAGGSAGVGGHVSQMQALAQELGALDTTVKNPTGLDAPGQQSSAYDLALFGRAVLAEPQLAALAATKSVPFPGKTIAPSKRATYQVGNLNRLLYNYDGAIGVKNGFTTLARSTTIAAARRGNQAYLLTALHRDSGTWGPEAELLDWAFRYGPRVQPVGRLVNRGEITASQPSISPAAQPTSSRPASVQRPATHRSWPLPLGLAVLLTGVALWCQRRASRLPDSGGPRRAR